MPKVREDLIPLKELILHLELIPDKELIPFTESIPHENDSFGGSKRFLQNLLKMAKESES